MSHVDVVVPCYNYAHYLEHCVQSVLTQRDVTVRVLIVDDQSPDNTPQIAAALCAADSRVNYIRNERNLGLIGTANAGVMQWAKGDYVVLLSADDALTPGSLARATAVLDANPDIALAYSLCLLMDDACEPAAPSDVQSTTWRRVEAKDFIRHNFRFGNPCASPSFIVRTSVQHAVGGYDPRFPHTSDMDLWMRCVLHGPAAVIREPGAFYRRHKSNMSSGYTEQNLGEGQEVINTCEAFAERFGATFPEMRSWLSELKRRFADEAFWLSGQALERGNKELCSARLAFARKHHPSPWLSRSAWGLRIKQVLGASIVRQLKDWKSNSSGTGNNTSPHAAVEMGPDGSACLTVGWWPDN